MGKWKEGKKVKMGGDEKMGRKVELGDWKIRTVEEEIGKQEEGQDWELGR